MDVWPIDANERAVMLAGNIVKVNVEKEVVLSR
jgi:hypothetical protein